MSIALQLLSTCCSSLFPIQGISFLDVKNQLMTSYMSNLGLLMDKKTCGKSVQNDPAIDRLVEIRTVRFYHIYILYSLFTH